jgi:hypothetical protein
MLYFRPSQVRLAGVAQLVEHLLAKEKVAGSNPVSRSIDPSVLPAGFLLAGSLSDPCACLRQTAEASDQRWTEPF